MITSFNFRQIRASLALALLVALAAASALLAPQSARMQSQITARIAFDRDNQVRVANADGSADTLLADGADPVWSPDGTKIAYAYGVEYSSEIFVMGANGENQTQLTQNGRSYSPAFSPDGAKIIFVSDHEGNPHIYTINADGSNQQRVVFAGDFLREHAPVFSPDGTKIVFLGTTLTGTGSSTDDYYIAGIDGSAPVRLTFTGGFNRNQASVSPDGENVLVARWSDIYEVKIDGSGAMTNITASPEAESDPDYSPDGSQIVFRRYQVGLMIMKADGTNATALNVEGDNPDWLPTAASPTPTPTVTPTATPTATPTPTPAAAPDLNVRLNASAQNVNVGGTVTFTVSVRNNGDAAANDVKVSSTALVAGETNRADYISANAPGGCQLVNGNTTLECQVGALAPHQSTVITIGVRPNVAGNMLFTSTAHGSELDRNESDNTNFADVLVGAAPACASEVTSSVTVRLLPAVRNPRTGEYEQIIMARNTSNQNLHPKAYFVFDNLTNGVQVAQSSDPRRTTCAAPLGSQYVTANTNGESWRPNQTIMIRVTFHNPQRRNIDYDLRVMAGANNP
ncbi:MAG TPA: hypothetical protein VK400_18885 [Pyrinomonadaceae bacterium]|nr:hypothetical protein [Pyrinomonadaceae bacterium]